MSITLEFINIDKSLNVKNSSKKNYYLQLIVDLYFIYFFIVNRDLVLTNENVFEWGIVSYLLLITIGISLYYKYKDFRLEKSLFQLWILIFIVLIMAVAIISTSIYSLYFYSQTDYSFAILMYTYLFLSVSFLIISIYNIFSKNS